MLLNPAVVLPLSFCQVLNFAHPRPETSLLRTGWPQGGQLPGPLRPHTPSIPLPTPACSLLSMEELPLPHCCHSCRSFGQNNPPLQHDPCLTIIPWKGSNPSLPGPDFSFVSDHAQVISPEFLHLSSKEKKIRYKVIRSKM